MLGSKKVSGTAAKLGRDAAYHHCTLLLNVDTSNLHSALNRLIPSLSISLSITFDHNHSESEKPNIFALSKDFLLKRHSDVLNNVFYFEILNIASKFYPKKNLNI